MSLALERSPRLALGYALRELRGRIAEELNTLSHLGLGRSLEACCAGVTRRV